MTDLEMMTSPVEWPRWPLLPLKRKVEGENVPQVATLYASDPPEFFDVSMYGLKEAVEAGMKGTKVSPQQLVNRGWIVD